MTQYPPTPPQPLPPTGPTTWPPAADRVELPRELVDDVDGGGYMHRWMAATLDAALPPLVFPRPKTDPALVGTVHDSRRPAGRPDVPQLPASG